MMSDASVFGIPGMTPGGLGIWGLLLSLLGMTVWAYFRIWPRMLELGIVKAKASHDGKRADLDACRERLDQQDQKIREMEERHIAEIGAINEKFDTAVAKANSLDKRLFAFATAYSLIAGELQRLAPDSAALMQAQRLFNIAHPPSDEDFDLSKFLPLLRGEAEG